MEFMQVFFLNTVMDDANELCMETAVSITLRLVSLFIGAEYAEPDAFRSALLRNAFGKMIFRNVFLNIFQTLLLLIPVQMLNK